MRHRVPLFKVFFIEHEHDNIGVLDLQHLLIDLNLDEYCEGL